MWAGIIDQTIIGQFNEGVKLNSANFDDFMNKTFFAYQVLDCCKINVFMHDSAPYVSKCSHQFFEHKIYRRDYNEWLPSKFNLNLVESLWSVVEMKLYEGSKQYNLDLCEAIKTVRNWTCLSKNINKINGW